MKRVMPARAEPEDVLDEDLKFLTVNVNADWRLQYDGHQFQVQERKTRTDKGKNAGEVWWKRHAYISDLDNTIVWLARKRVYLSGGVFDGRALIHICKVLDEIKAETMKAGADMRTLMLQHQQPTGGSATPVLQSAPKTKASEPEPKSKRQKRA